MCIRDRPNACETKMVMTMNCRSLNNFFNLRCCNRAQWEIRAVADEMLRLVYPLAPHVFAAAGPRCLAGPCPEGGMCCGKQNAVRDKYATLKPVSYTHLDVYKRQWHNRLQSPEGFSN